MSDHYCCKTCGQRYDECTCPPVIGDNLKAPSLRDRMQRTVRPAKVEIATAQNNLLMQSTEGGWEVRLNGVLIVQATERARCTGVFDALRHALQL
jgi:hypothetical protein